MAKGGRANLERLLRRAWEMQKQKKLFSKTSERTSFDWRDLLLAGLALFTETLALLVGISILALAAAILFWFAIRNYRKERHLSWSTQRGITCGVFVMLVTMLPVVFNSYRGRHLGPTEAKVSSSASNSEPANREPSAPTAPLTAKEIADEVARRLPTVDADASDKKDVSIKKSSGFLQLLDLEILRPGIVAGKPILINFYLENRGSEPVYQASRFFGMQFIPVNQNEPNKTDEKFFADARKHRIKEKTQVDNSVGVGEKIWNTLSNDAPTPEQSESLRRGELRLYIYAWAHWRGEEQDLEVCRWLQRPDDGQQTIIRPVWHNCVLKQHLGQPNPPTPRSTLHDMFMHDFEEMHSQVVGGHSLASNEVSGTKTMIEYRVFSQLEVNVGFVSYYIPQTNETHGICQYLAAIRPHFIENSKHFTFTERSPGESEERSSQAVGISSRVFVYHETFLSPEEIVELNRTYRAHGFDVIFRGPDYLAIKNAGK